MRNSELFDNIENRIRIGLPPIEDDVLGRIRIDDNSNRISSSANIIAAQVFAQNVREKMGHDLETPIYTGRSSRYYRNNCYLNESEVTGLAQRWSIPLAILHVEEQMHWNLLLGLPEQYNGTWRVLVYDPMRDNEFFRTLPNGFTRNVLYHSQRIPSHTFSEFRIYCNALGHEQILNGSYSYSLTEDEEIVRNRDILTAKETRVQYYEGYNCGLHCIFSAILRESMKPSSRNFWFGIVGKEKLAQDTGLYVLSRDEVLG